MKLRIKPLHDLIIVQPDEAESVTKGGLIIPDSVKEKPQRGTIISVGGKTEEVKEMNKVLYKKFSGTEIEVDGKKYLIMSENDILAII